MARSADDARRIHVSSAPAPHPGHGPQEPGKGTPARRPGSFRRTTTHTSLRPDGILGDVHMQALGRDLWTGPDGAVETVARARLDAIIDFVGDRSLKALTVDPNPGVSLDGLVGRSVWSGFRRALDQTWPAPSPAASSPAAPPAPSPAGPRPDLDRGASLLYQLLDELPTAALVSGYAIGAAGIHPPAGSSGMSLRADICAGWVTGGTMLVQAEKLGHTPPLRGPLAPSLDSPGDPAAWHAMGPVGPHAMRRRRRIDVWRPEAHGPLAVEAFFRDSHVDPEGVETVVHEYLVTAEMEPGTNVLRSCRAEAGTLPWVECPGALASAGRLAGTAPDDLRDRVRQTFVGTTTCTHLNDTLRALAVLPHAAAMVERLGPLG